MLSRDNWSEKQHKAMVDQNSQETTGCCPNHKIFVQSGGLIVIMLAVVR